MRTLLIKRTFFIEINSEIWLFRSDSGFVLLSELTTKLQMSARLGVSCPGWLGIMRNWWLTKLSWPLLCQSYPGEFSAITTVVLFRFSGYASQIRVHIHRYLRFLMDHHKISFRISETSTTNCYQVQIRSVPVQLSVQGEAEGNSVGNNTCHEIVTNWEET